MSSMFCFVSCCRRACGSK